MMQVVQLIADKSLQGADCPVSPENNPTKDVCGFPSSTDQDGMTRISNSSHASLEKSITGLEQLMMKNQHRVEEMIIGSESRIKQAVETNATGEQSTEEPRRRMKSELEQNGQSKHVFPANGGPTNLAPLVKPQGSEPVHCADDADNLDAKNKATSKAPPNDQYSADEQHNGQSPMHGSTYPQETNGSCLHDEHDGCSLPTSGSSSPNHRLGTSPKIPEGAPANFKLGRRPSVEDTTNEVFKQMWQARAAATEDERWKGLKTGNESRAQLLALQLLSSILFERIVGVIILANSIFIAVQTNWTAENLREADAAEWKYTDYCFTAFFSCEVVLRIVAERKRFLTGKSRGWNLFDLGIVLTSILEECLSLASSTRVVRILRFLRLIRLARFIRVMRFFSELRAMVWGIMHSIASLVWAIILLIIVMFIFACYITQTV